MLPGGSNWKPSSLPRRSRPRSCIRRWPGSTAQKVTELAKALQEPDSRSDATEALRGLVDAIVLTPDQGGETLQIELRGNLAAMLGATVQTKRSSESDDLSLQVSLVAGAGFEPATFGL
jgi:site-specific DNA recombinase